MFFWSDIKGGAVVNLPIDHEALHVHLGLALFLSLAWAFRHRRYGVIGAWIALLCIQLSNEALDVWDFAKLKIPVRWPEAISDTFNTMLWPTACMIVFVVWQHRGNTTA